MLYRVALQALSGVEEEAAAVEEEQGAGDGVARVGAEADDLMIGLIFDCLFVCVVSFSLWSLFVTLNAIMQMYRCS